MTKTIKTILLLIIIIFSFQIFVPTTLADEPESLEFTPQVPIPGSKYFDGGTTTVGVSETAPNEDGRQVTTMRSTLLPRYIRAIYDYGIGIAAFLALAMIVAGGLIWLTSGGSTNQVSTAKSMITSSIIGLVLLLGTYTLLQLVNPDLLNFKPIETEYIGALQIGCCEIKEYDGIGRLMETRAKNASNKECDSLNSKDKYKTEFKPDSSPGLDSKKCELNGCCILNYSGATMYHAAQIYCVDMNEQTCVKMAEDSYVSLENFDPLKCSVVGDNYKCDDKDVCKKTKDGNRCAKGLINCWCYDETPTYGKGKQGERCGNEQGSTCYSNADYQIDNNGKCDKERFFFEDDYWGRKCESGLKCCYYEKD